MAELKTKPEKRSVKEFIDSLDDERKRKDSYELVEIMKEVIDAEPQMWGSSIIGFGDYHYKSKSGREGDWFLTGFSPRKQAISLYILGGLKESDLIEKLGKFKNGKGCIYVKRLEDVDKDVLREMVRRSTEKLKENNQDGS